MMKFMLVFGTRPAGFKMAPLVKEFQKHSDQIKTVVCVTAQHRELLDQVLDVFDITPDYDLDVMTRDQDLCEMSSRVLLGMGDVLQRVKPDLVFVHGDTATSLMAALAAFYQKIDVAHVEAGLRTYDMTTPWPEEMHRQLTGRISKYHFAPTNASRKNLLAENVRDDRIVVTGNTVVDALCFIRDKISSDADLRGTLRETILGKGYAMSDRKYVLVTGHRRENFGVGLANICDALVQVSANFPACDIVFPVHPNPNIQTPVIARLGDISNIFLLPPLEYLSFTFLLSRAAIVVTDSGGIQEEAPYFGVPILVLRKMTDRAEGLASGVAKLVGTDVEPIVREISALLRNDAYKKKAKVVSPYGDGKACERIVREFI